MNARLFVRCFVVLVALCIAQSAFAAPRMKATARAVSLANAAMERGAKLAEGGDDERALAEFRAAQELVPNANLPWRYAAESLERLARYDEALAAYSRYLELRPSVKDGPLVSARMAALERERAKGSVDVLASPSGVSVFVDDEPAARGTAPMNDLRLSPGEHTLFLRAPGFEDATLKIDVRSRERTILRATLVRIAPPVVEKDVMPKDSGWSTRTWGLLTIGAGAVLLGGTATTDALVLGDARRDFERARDAGDGTAMHESDRFEATRAAVIASYAASATALAVGAVLFFWPKAERAGLTARATGQGGGVGLRF